MVVTSTPQFGEIVRQQLLASAKPDDGKSAADNDKDKDKDKDKDDKDAENEDKPSRNYAIEVDPNASEAERTALAESSGLPATSMVTCGSAMMRLRRAKLCTIGREAGGFMEKSWLSGQLDHAILLQELAQRGVSGTQADELLKPVKLETMRVEGGKETKSNDRECSSRFLPW